MVLLSHVRDSNALIPTNLPAGLVALFVGGTSGIGEATVKALAKHAVKPQVYIAGRSREAADAIISECKVVNPRGIYHFVAADLSLIKGADQLCREIQQWESRLDLLFLSIGQSDFSRTVTSEGLHLLAALNYYSRIRIIQQLLPLIQQSASLRRIVSVGGGGYEESLDTSDIQALRVPRESLREHLSTVVTLGLEGVARSAPGVTFIHSYPGTVNTPLLKNMPPEILTKLTFVPVDESGDRNLYLATSPRFPPKEPGPHGTSAEDVAEGNDGQKGSGFYSVGEDCESVSRDVVEKLAVLRREGTVDLVQSHTREHFARIESEQGV